MAAGQAVRESGAARLVQRGVRIVAGDEGGTALPEVSEFDDRGGGADRVLEGGGGAGAARGEHPLQRRVGGGGPGRVVQAWGERDRLPGGVGGDVHGETGPHLDGVE